MDSDGVLLERPEFSSLVFFSTLPLPDSKAGVALTRPEIVVLPDFDCQAPVFVAAAAQ